MSTCCAALGVRGLGAPRVKVGHALVLAAGLSAGAMAQVDSRRSEEPVTRFDGDRVVRVEIKNARDLQTVSALTDDFWTESIRRKGPVDVMVTQEQFVALVASGLRFSVLIDDVQRRIDQETAEVRARQGMDDATWYTNYHNYADTKTYCQNLAAANPGICQYIVLGQSLQGRDMFGLRITGPGSTANRPAGLWWGGQHAREWVTEPVTEYSAEKLLTLYATDPHIQYLVNNVEFIFVPIMNPDGYDYTWTSNRLWRKNRRANTGTGCTTTVGVDLNRNWGYEWGIAGTATSGNCGDDTYYGPSPFSEPETQVMRNFIQGNPRLKVTMDWHSYSQLVMSPWGWTSALPTPPSVAQAFQNMDNQMAAAIHGVHGMTYDAGPIYATIYPASGTSVDWAYGAQGIQAFTTELRDTGQNGFTLPTNQITPTCEENYAAFLVMANAIVVCYPNCDGSTTAPILNVNDFTCFLQKFSTGDTYANCDGSTSAPVLNVSDFTCFLQKFAAGCP
jgi:murein tripeptide amidase MpaA